MLLMIDNYDSFTYNLVQYFGELEQDVSVYRNDEITLDDVAALKPRHIVISPGPCTPKEAGISVPLINEFAGKVPILGVCLGHQSIGQAFGGNVVHAQAGNARKDLGDTPSCDRRIPQYAGSFAGNALSLARDRAPHAARMSRSYRMD